MSESEQRRSKAAVSSGKDHDSSTGTGESTSFGTQHTIAPILKANEPQGTYTDNEIAQELNALFVEDQLIVDDLRYLSKIVFRAILGDLKDEQIAPLSQKVLTVLLRARETSPKIRQIFAETDGIALR
jgi:hypothetical protein